jgi:hypothetical protein
MYHQTIFEKYIYVLQVLDVHLMQNRFISSVMKMFLSSWYSRSKMMGFPYVPSSLILTLNNWLSDSSQMQNIMFSSGYAELDGAELSLASSSTTSTQLFISFCIFYKSNTSFFFLLI